MTADVKVKLRSGEDTVEIPMTRVPHLREEIVDQGRIWKVVAVSFLLTNRVA